MFERFTREARRTVVLAASGVDPATIREGLLDRLGKAS